MNKELYALPIVVSNEFGGWLKGLKTLEQIDKYKNTRQYIENPTANMDVRRIMIHISLHMMIRDRENYWIYVASIPIFKSFTLTKVVHSNLDIMNLDIVNFAI